MNLTICIATYGEPAWEKLALTRALPSVKDFPCEILVGHDPDGTLASARNGLAERAVGEWLCFLDADDELAPGFLDAMTRAEQAESPSALLLTPAVSFVLRGARKLPAHFQPDQPLQEGNPLIIGTLIPAKVFHRVGGFRHWPLFEDWDLWARCDVPIVKVPDALYLAHVNTKSRNRVASEAERNYWHQMIGHDIWPDYYDSPTAQEHQARKMAGVRKLAVA